MNKNFEIIGKTYIPPKSIFTTEFKKVKQLLTPAYNYDYEHNYKNYSPLSTNEKPKQLDQNNFKKLFVVSDEKNDDSENIYNLIDDSITKTLVDEIMLRKVDMPSEQITKYDKKYKLSEPFEDINLTSILPSKYSIENNDFSFADDIFIGSFLPAQIVYSKYHEIIVPIDLGLNSGDCIIIKLSDICGMFNAHLLGKSYLSFSQKVNIDKIIFYQNNYGSDEIVDTIYGSYLNILLKLNIIQNINLSNGNYVVQLPFFFDDHHYAFPAFKYQNVYLKIMFTEKIQPTEIKLTTTLYYLGPYDLDRFTNSKYLPSYFLQHGGNHHKEIVNISDNNAVVLKLDNFKYNISCIFIKLSPMNGLANLALYGTVMLNANNVALIDPDINSINLEVNNNKVKNLYMIPFTIDKKIGKNNPNGSLSVKSNSLQLRFKIFSENNIDTGDIEIEIFAPRYNIIKYRENNTLLVSYE